MGRTGIPKPKKQAQNCDERLKPARLTPFLKTCDIVIARRGKSSDQTRTVDIMPLCSEAWRTRGWRAHSEKGPSFFLSATKNMKIPPKKYLWGGFAVVILLITIIIAFFGTSTPPGGDPGNQHLNELASDQVFAVMPDGATTINVVRTPAQYQDNGPLEGSGWRGPYIIVTFHAGSSPADVYASYSKRAMASGWRPRPGTGALGFIDVWYKTYPDRAAATLSLLPALEENPRTTNPQIYRLTGSVTAKAGV